MSNARGAQHACARCRRRFAQPITGRNNAVCEDCQDQEDQPR